MLANELFRMFSARCEEFGLEKPTPLDPEGVVKLRGKISKTDVDIEKLLAWYFDFFIEQNQKLSVSIGMLLSDMVIKAFMEEHKEQHASIARKQNNVQKGLWLIKAVGQKIKTMPPDQKAKAITILQQYASREIYLSEFEKKVKDLIPSQP